MSKCEEYVLEEYKKLLPIKKIFDNYFGVDNWEIEEDILKGRPDGDPYEVNLSSAIGLFDTVSHGGGDLFFKTEYTRPYMYSNRVHDHPLIDFEGVEKLQDFRDTLDKFIEEYKNETNQ